MFQQSFFKLLSEILSTNIYLGRKTGSPRARHCWWGCVNVPNWIIFFSWEKYRDPGILLQRVWKRCVGVSNCGICSHRQILVCLVLAVWKFSTWDTDWCGVFPVCTTYFEVTLTLLSSSLYSIHGCLEAKDIVEYSWVTMEVVLCFQQSPFVCLSVDNCKIDLFDTVFCSRPGWSKV